jgi:hypothetical protein
MPKHPNKAFFSQTDRHAGEIPAPIAVPGQNDLSKLYDGFVFFQSADWGAERPRLSLAGQVSVSWFQEPWLIFQWIKKYCPLNILGPIMHL